MPRRSHKKSRNGCVECKARHVKCDENRPECVNCLTAGSRCSFREGATVRTKHPPPVPSSYPTPSNAPSPIDSRPSATLAPTSLSRSEPALNLQHLELLHQFCTITYATLFDEADMQDVWRRTVPRHALSSPFLMYELLAIAALHLGHLHPSHREYYYDRAVELQNSAMAGFQAIEMRVDESNCVAVLLFSSLLALQVLADPNPPADSTSTGYIDHFARCFKLMQGTRVLVIQRWWPTISSQDELLPLFRDTLFTDVDSRSVPVEIAKLSEITQIQSLSEEACAAYDEAIDKLQWLYRASEIPHRKYTVVKWVLGWPVQLKPEYLELLDQRRPEALVILAYYGVLLHFYQESWVIRDTGKRLVTAISEQVGVHMEQWLQWPKQVINSE